MQSKAEFPFVLFGVCPPFSPTQAPFEATKGYRRLACKAFSQYCPLLEKKLVLLVVYASLLLQDPSLQGNLLITSFHAHPPNDSFHHWS